MQLYDDSAFWEHKFLPFTKARLACYLHNPRAELDDPLWIMAFKDDKVVAYLALVPDYINTLQGAKKIAWFSSWWAEPQYRGTGLAERLTSLGFGLYDGIAIDSGNPWSMQKMMDSGNFELYQQRQRRYYFLAMNKKVLRDNKVSNPLFYILLPFLRPLLALISKVRLKLWLAQNKQANLKVEYNHQLDAQSMEMIQVKAAGELVFKDEAYLEYRAFLPSKLAFPSFIPKKHHSYFGNVGSTAECQIVKLWQKEKFIGWVSYCIVDSALNLKFHYMRENHEKELLYLIAKLCLEFSVDLVFSQDAFIHRYLLSFRFPFLFSKTHEVPMLMSKSLMKLVDSGKHLFDGEGAF